MLEAAEGRAREIRTSAEKDARELRQGAARDAGALFEKLENLERPLDALVNSVRGELDSLTTEFRRHWPVDDVIVQAVPDQFADTPQGAEPKPEVEPEPEVEVEQPAEPKGERPEPEPEPEAEVEQPAEPGPAAKQPEAEPEPQPQEAPAQEPQTVQPAAFSDTNGKRGRLSWLKRRKTTLFISTPGQCAVCYRSFAAGSEEALNESGWKVSGELGLCPQCQEDGWQLPEGARLPYRRAAT